MLKLRWPVLIALSIVLLFLCMGAKTCTGRSKSKTKAGSSTEWLGINAPSNLTATAISSTSINISWQNNANNADGFEIQRKMWSNGAWGLITTVAINIISFNDTELRPLTEYYYRIRAFNLIGDRSPYSNEANATTLDLKWNYIVTGEAHNIGRTDDGRIWAWGLNDFYQLGINDNINRSVPTPVNTENDWRLISTGTDHNLCIKTDNSLWVWVPNQYGELGLGDTLDTPLPIQAGNDFDWSFVEGGGIVVYDPEGSSIGIKNDRTIWSWGNNWKGQLGIGYSSPATAGILAPIQVGTDSDWSLAKIGSRYVIALKTNNTLWSWGINNDGQLGLGDYGFGTERYTPTQIAETDSDWIYITAGADHAIALKDNGSIWSWGSSTFGQLGRNSSLFDIPIQIGSDTNWSTTSAGRGHSVALKNNRTLWVWGHNEYSNLGFADTVNRPSPTQLGTDSDWSMISAGGFGIAEEDMPSITNSHHTIAIKTDGSLWAWGCNRYGQLGIGTTTDLITPTKTGVFIPNPPLSLTATVISSTEIRLGWIDIAYNESGFILEKSSVTNTNYSAIATLAANINYYADISITAHTPYYYRVKSYNPIGESDYSNEVRIMAGYWQSITAGYYHSIGIKETGALYVWGWNSYGQLGLGNSGSGTERNIPTQVFTTTNWSYIAGGGDHTLAVNLSGNLFSWGRNQYGQLGLATTTDTSTPAQVDLSTDWAFITAGESFSVALKKNNSLWTWGYNAEGQLGLGNTLSRLTPTQLGSETSWFVMDAGKDHAIALKNSGTIWSWGKNNFGQLGIGNTENRYTPSQIDTDSDWDHVTAGNYYSHGIKNNGTIWSWGKNTTNQLGLSDLIVRETPTQIGTNSDWSSCSAGGEHTIAIKTDRTMWSWGNNGSGQIGVGVMGGSQPFPIQIGTDSDWDYQSAGENHSIARKVTGTSWAWGFNIFGLLGIGETNGNRDTPTLIGN